MGIGQWAAWPWAVLWCWIAELGLNILLVLPLHYFKLGVSQVPTPFMTYERLVPGKLKGRIALLLIQICVGLVTSSMVVWDTLSSGQSCPCGTQGGLFTNHL